MALELCCNGKEMQMRKYFLIVDTETTQTDKVADFGAVVCNRKGEIVNQAACLVGEFYNDRENHPLFHYSGDDPLWGRARLPLRYAAYDSMVSNGLRGVYSVAGINRWLARVNAEYKPVLTAYNLAFDKGKARNSGIDLDQFSQSFCLWHSAAQKWSHTKAYRQFIIDGHWFKNRTKHGNMSYPTNAEIMAAFVTNNPDMPSEPHTALEDAVDYELPILKRLVETTSPKEYMNPIGYNWRSYQVKDWFQPK